ncbi:MAG: hypothetical protein VYE18_04955, partial [Pseudomonadota bacterium]|nr:hypothetical protein [Pseudomonadota bacterium]
AEPEVEDAAPKEPAPVAVFPRPAPETVAPEQPATAERAERPVYTKPIPSVAGITEPAQTNVTQEAAPEVAPEVALASPSATPQADTFIPAPPVMGNVAVEDKSKADPFTVADMVNTRIEPEEIELPKKSLFERVTGVGRPERRVPKRDRTLPPALPPKQEPEEIEASPAPKGSDVAKAMTPEPTLDEIPSVAGVAWEKPAPAPEIPAPVAFDDSIAFTVTDQEAPPATTESAPESTPELETEDQGAFGGLDPDEHLSDSNNTDDLLEIPAFLRRQAN